MVIGWAWKWPRPKCSIGISPHTLVTASFIVTNYEPTIKRGYVWKRCSECGKIKEQSTEKVS